MTYVYMCEGGERVDVTYRPGQAFVTHRRVEMSLRQMPSASGAAYADDEVVWQTKGDEGQLVDVRRQRTLATRCRPSDASAATETTLPSDVVGKTWQWVSFTSPVEQLNVEASERYTIRFERNGTVAVRADCNRGGAAYSVSDGRQVVLQPVALTRMTCSVGSLADRFAKDVGRARNFSLKDGDLFLELPDNAGTLRFRRER